MREDLKELFRFRELLFSMVERDLKIRYKNSFFGFLWSFINPIATMLVLTFVFRVIMRNPIPNFSANLLAALLPFLFIQQAVLDASQSVIQNASIMKKVYFPREIYPLAVILSNFVHLLSGMLMFYAFLVVVYLISYIKNPATAHFQFSDKFWLLPFMLLLSLTLASGLGLFFSALNTMYEDVKYILTIVFQILFYMCPVVYFAEQVAYTAPVPEKYKALFYNIYMANPVAEIVHAFRRSLLPAQPFDVNGHGYLVGIGAGKLLFCSVLSVLVLIGGYNYFNKVKWRFMERP